MTHISWPLRTKSPTVDRFLCGALLCFCLCVPSLTLAQEGKTVEGAVRLALEQPDTAARLRVRIQEMRAELDEATLVPTPELAVSHEQVFGDLNVGYLESSALVEQRIDLSGWREALRDSAPHRESALSAEMEVWRLDVATAVREAFYRVRYRDERIRVIDAWIEQLEQGLVSLSARQARGDVSAYQVRRLEREIELARTRRATELSMRAEAWTELATWTSWPASSLLVGVLRPSAPTPAREPATSWSRPELARLEHMELAIDAETEAWGRPLLRGWTVGAGYRYAEVGPSTGHGLLLTLSLPLTLWNTDLPRLQRLQARRLALQGERELGQKLAARETGAARERLDATLQALDEFSERSDDADLIGLTLLAFEADEATLTELLDAFESDMTLQLARIDLQWEARRAAIALDRSLGLGVSP